MRHSLWVHLLLIVSLQLCCNAFAIGQAKAVTSSCSEKASNYSLQWNWLPKQSSVALPRQSGNFVLPHKYELFEVVAVNLKDRLTSLKQSGGTLTLPFITTANGSRRMDCLTFKVVNSGTLPKELNDKYPELVSLKGADIRNKYNTVRFDYDGTFMNISVTCNGVDYLYSPYKAGNKVYYLLFKKADANRSSRLTK